MRGILLFLVLATILMLGIAGCPKSDSASSGGGEVRTVGTDDAGGATDESADDGGGE